MGSGRSLNASIIRSSYRLSLGIVALLSILGLPAAAGSTTRALFSWFPPTNAVSSAAGLNLSGPHRLLTFRIA
ncbi:hypothetical protein M407DRAFT_241787 [Tulasnella calospora MUT 4182]|uniref:Uncharacterized protein n=1 Tax=Tulasnella calospora MUT 4182 TaxID=1051891 RepID=A0A0C3MCC1_9AGAM|nr:hypothetical protein M407DRAFT_241787 [Tulasnella calospora MUT 4182]